MEPATSTPAMENPEQLLQAERERTLRLAADLDNLKKRMNQEIERRVLKGRDAFASDLLPIIDNLELATNHGNTSADADVREGIRLIYRQMLEVMKRYEYHPRDDMGKEFDPKYHYAVALRTLPEKPARVVVEVWQRGWMRGNDIIRPAKVVVNDLQTTEAITT